VSHTIYLRDRSSGRIHVAVRHGLVLLTAEGDNLDTAGERDEITLAEAMEADSDALCGRCFPGGDLVEKVED
jgi:hypothetical protein